jgi:YD repeat-containing protein
VNSTTFTATYRADGQAATLAAPNGNTTTYGYDPLGRPTAKTTTGSGGVARAAYAWTHNRAGQILTETSTDGFPSEELTFVEPSGKRSVLFRHNALFWGAMAEGIGNWSTTRYVPRYFSTDAR